MKQKLLIGALIVAGLASIAYAAFSQSLVINGSASTSADWNVRITGITRTSANGAVDLSGTPSFTATSANFDVNLSYPGASATYQITVKNEGSIPAKLDSLTDIAAINAAAPADLTFTLSGVSAGSTTLPAGSTNTVIVTTQWSPSSTITANQTKSATITLNYIQDTP